MPQHISSGRLGSHVVDIAGQQHQITGKPASKKIKKFLAGETVRACMGGWGLEK